MKTERFDDYYKHECSFSGRLVVVNYFDDMKKDPKWGINANLVFDYLEKAKNLVAEKQYDVVEVLLSVPEYVVRIK